jgi:hypothetical protein
VLSDTEQSNLTDQKRQILAAGQVNLELDHAVAAELVHCPLAGEARRPSLHWSPGWAEPESLPVLHQSRHR